MIHDLKPYPAYKDSDVSWLGEVPEHWEVVTLGRIGKFFKGNGGTKDDEVEEGIPCIRYGDLYTQYKFFIRTCRSFVSTERASDYTAIRCGDVLFAGSGETIEEIGKSAVNLLDSEACCGGDILLWRPTRKVVPHFLGYASDSPQSVYQKACMGRGVTVMHIYSDRLKNLWLALPPLLEQSAIARFLDHIGRRIGRAIRAKQKLIALLNEQKQAIVHQAVTRGLNPNVRLKPSGVAWLGDVPEHWEVKRLRYAVDMRVSNVDKHSKDEELPVRLCNYVDVYKNDLITERMPFMRATATYEEVEKFRLRRGDVLITKDSEAWDDIGVPALVDYESEDLVCGYHLAVLRPRADQVQGGYLLRALQCPGVADQFYVSANGVTRYGLSHAAIKSVWLPLPSPTEQTAIVAYLDKAIAGIDTAIDRAHSEFSLLREYRTRLIADVVTGKLDVREAAARLPEEAEVPEPLDEADALLDGDEEAEGVDLDATLDEALA